MQPEEINHINSLLESDYVDAARHSLENILEANPRDLQAWSLYVKSWKSLDKRIQAMELCLKYNPGNPQVTRALEGLKQKRAVAQTPPAAPPPPAPKPAAPPPTPQSPASANDLPAWLAGLGAADAAAGMASNAQPERPAWMDEPAAGGLSGAKSSPAPSHSVRSGWESPADEKPAWAMDTSARETFNQPVKLSKEEIERQAREYVEERSKQGKGKKYEGRKLEAGRPMAWYEVWFTALTQPNLEAYEALRANPYNLPSRSILWLLTSGMISGVVIALAFRSNPQFLQLLASMEQDFPEITQSFSLFLLCIIPLSGIMYLINTAFRVGIQHIVAMLMGGKGRYSDFLYLVAAFSAPATMVTSILNLLPYVGGCLTAPLGFYSIYLNVKAIEAAHDFNTLKAFGVILGIFLFNLIFVCLIAYLFFPYIQSYMSVPAF